MLPEYKKPGKYLRNGLFTENFKIYICESIDRLILQVDF